jgi:protein-disulfide isomerase
MTTRLWEMKKPPVTIIEFVDYECPFRKSFFDETLPKIKSEYIDTGKVKLVIRDFPLDFHENAKGESFSILENLLAAETIRPAPNNIQTNARMKALG